VSDQLAYYRFFGFPGEWLLERYQPYADRFPPGARVLDVGCGRGEFLELLGRRGVHGVGVDSDPSMVAAVREKGLEAEPGEAVAFLEANPDAFDGVFAAHLIEHLSPDALSGLVRAAAQALRPDGRLILVSPNPRNLRMLTNDFWIDLQHVRFYHPEIVRFLMHLAGLRDIEMGENERYPLGPELATADPAPLPAARPPQHALGRERLAMALPPSIGERLSDLEERVNLLTGWARTLYPPGEYFVTAVR
jgi:SAM-dependent methyltransferase